MPAVGSILEVAVAAWTFQGTLGQYPIQRRHQWYRDGVAIPGADGLAHTPEVAGTYTVTETAFYLSRSSTGGFLESSSTTVTSAPMVVTGTLDPNLVYLKDLNWLGAFRPPDVPYIDNASVWRDFGYGLTSLSFSPTGNGGLGSIFGTAHSGYGVGEFTIPTPSKTSPPFATLLTLPTINPDPTEGAVYNSGIPGWSVTYIQVYGDRLLVTGSSKYASTNAQWFFSRPLNLNTTGDVRGPYSVRGVYGERFHAGYMSPVPPEMQTKLGGPYLCGLSAESIQGATSDGPPIATFNPADFSTVNSVRVASGFGTITGNTFVLSGGSSVDNYYVGWRVALQDATDPFILALTVTAYNGTTKVVTTDRLSEWVSYGVSPTRPIIMVPKIDATDLAMYGLFELQNYKPYGKYCGVWEETCSQLGEGVAINGTRSVLVFGRHGDGMTQYAIGSGGSYDNGEISNEGFRVYDPGNNSRGEHAYPYNPRIWAYDANDLEQARLGNVLPKNVKPYAVFDFTFPATGGSAFFYGGATYDPKTRRLYVGASSGYGFGQSIIHVYEVTNAVAVP
jgi:hypothetical protein